MVGCGRKLGPYDCCTVVCGDCLQLMRELPDGCVDACITDPPYGIGYDASSSNQRGIQKFEMILGEESQFDARFLLRFSDVICWGANHYAHSLPQKEGQFYVWDKVLRNELDVRIAECEFCWHKKGTKPRIFRHLWSGAYRDSEWGIRSLHPNQKPLALMEWCIRQAGMPETILDPFLGSGTTAVAAKKLGRHFLGFEISPEYCRIAEERIALVEMQPQLFTPQPEQLPLNPEL